MTNVIIPLIVFAVVVGVTWFLLTALSQRNSQAEERLAKIGRPKSLVDIEIAAQAEAEKQRFATLQERLQNIGRALEPQSDLEKSNLKIALANAGFRGENAASVYQGIRMATLAALTIPPAIGFWAYFGGPTMDWIIYTGVCAGLGFYLPQLGLWWLRTSRQQAIFLSLPDALDLMVVCVEAGLGLDAAMRRVADEMREHAKVISEEFALANLQLQMGRPRREVLHDLGVRTGVDDVRSLAAILIQADRFGSSIAQALRVQSDSMRTRRRQVAEEKAAKTAVQLIFPLVLFIFPGIFVVLVGPAAIQICEVMLKK
jgi:tight adherence protein C